MLRLLKEFEHLKIQLAALKLATNNFADDRCIGKGGFGKVYKGEIVLPFQGHTTVAIKRLDRAFGQGDPEFWKEIIMLSVYKHKNIVSLLGFCDESNEKILIYEYASKGSLDFYLDNHDLTWIRRLKICIGAARGLAFLHNPGATQQRVLHRDIKSSNILLDDNWNAMISDLGLSKFGPANQQYTFLVSHTVGTIGYCDPQYIQTGLLTKESDVYSFGVVLFEILCGRLCIGNKNDQRPPLLSMVQDYNKINEIIYSNMHDEINPKSLKAFTTIAYRCLKTNHEERPLMTQVVSMLENALEYQAGDIIPRIVDGFDTTEMVFSDRQSSGESRATSNNDTVSHLGWGRCYTLRELEAATNGLADENVIGKGGYGIVYSGVLGNNTRVAVKNLLNNRGQAEREFKVEVEAIGRVGHKNLVRLLGYCVEGAYRMLVYEYVDNGNLEQWLHGDVGDVSPLTWRIRMNIIQGTAKGLAYLHDGLEPKVVHRDIKSNNILLDRQWNPKVSDFGLAKLLGYDASYVPTRVMGTFGYVAPEYECSGMLTEKSDVYSFGILIMEIITGRNPVDYGRPQGEVDLLERLKTMVGSRKSDEVVDPKLPEMPSSKALKLILLVALRCVDPVATKRPNMGQVLHMLATDDLLFPTERRDTSSSNRDYKVDKIGLNDKRSGDRDSDTGEGTSPPRPLPWL